MKFSASTAVLAMTGLTCATAQPVSHHHQRRASPTIYTCGDSTMAKDGAANGETDGWGEYLGNYTTATVVNKAIAGRSARSYWEEGRFSAVADLVVEGDIVVIEFGHNDGGSPESDDNGRSDCPGDGTETCTSDADGSTVYTFVYYVVQAAKMMIEKGATVVLSTQTPNNPCTLSLFWSPILVAGAWTSGHPKTALRLLLQLTSPTQEICMTCLLTRYCRGDGVFCVLGASLCRVSSDGRRERG